jgi:hypothetical protein
MPNTEYSDLLKSEVENGKCTIVQGKPNAISKTEVTVVSSIVGRDCSFGGSYDIRVQMPAERQVIMDAKMGITVKNPKLLAESDVSGTTFQMRMTINSSPDGKSAQVAANLDGVTQTRSLGPVTSSTSISLDMAGSAAPKMSMSSRYQSRAWDALFAMSVNTDGTPITSLNGEEVDPEILKELSAGVSAATGRNP